MDDNTISPERSRQLKALEIQMMFKCKGVSAEKCYLEAKERLTAGEITHKQFNWLAGQGCLGHKLLEQAKKMWGTSVTAQLNLSPKNDE